MFETMIYASELFDFHPKKILWHCLSQLLSFQLHTWRFQIFLYLRKGIETNFVMTNHSNNYTLSFLVKVNFPKRCFFKVFKYIQQKLYRKTITRNVLVCITKQVKMFYAIVHVVITTWQSRIFFMPEFTCHTSGSSLVVWYHLR